MDKSKALAKSQKEKTVELAADFGKVYIKVRGPNEIMRPVKSQIALYERLGHLYKIKDSYAISHSGYSHLNKVASVNIVTPQRVMIDERERLNPHIERNPRTKLIETVNIRKIGIGYSPLGNVVVVDKTLLYNLYAYFIESVQAKMKRVKYSKEGKPTSDKLYPNCAVTGIEDEKPKLSGKWAFFETVSPLGLWVNYEDPAIIDCLNEHTQKQRFGDRIAQTIVERNILKSHPAIATSTVVPQEKKTSGDNVAYVTVYGYRNELMPADLKNILDQAEKGSETIEVTQETISSISPDEEAAAMKEVEAEEAAEPEAQEAIKPATKNKKESPGLILEQEQYEDEDAKPEKTPGEMNEPPPEYWEQKRKREASYGRK